MFMNLGPQMADISMYNQRPHFNTGPHGVGTPPPLKKIDIRALSCFKLAQIRPRANIS